MADHIYYLAPDGTLEAIADAPFLQEYDLQELLAKHPNILAGEQMTPKKPRRWVLISREMPVPDDEGASGKWRLDHLFVDQESVPTLVEVKRGANKEVRRRVVGQMLDYAANAVLYWPVETIRAKFEEECRGRYVDPDDYLATALDPDSEDGFDTDAFWKQVRLNLTAGRLRLVFVADEVPRELERIVKFLSDQMERAEVFAVEVKQYRSEGRTILVPRVIGMKDERPDGGSHSWTEDKFFEALSRSVDQSIHDVIRRLYGWSISNFSEIGWSNSAIGKFFGRIKHNGTTSPMAVWHTGRVFVRFVKLKTRAPFDDVEYRKQFQERLNQIPGIMVPEEKLNGYYEVDPMSIASDENFRQFTSAFAWVIDTIRDA